MEIVADLHLHTVATKHAFSTVQENARAASEKGLYAIAITEHGPAMLDAPPWYFFKNLLVVPDELFGVRILKGCEVNVLSYRGNLDMQANVLAPLDWVVASFHKGIMHPKTAEEHTKGHLAVAENPYIDVIGHCGQEAFPFDHEKVVKAFKEYGKIVEVNAGSFFSRPGSAENCRDIVRYCKKYEVPVVLDSDAHYCDLIGRVQPCIDMIEELGYPEKLVVNADVDRLCTYLERRKERIAAL